MRKSPVFFTVPKPPHRLDAMQPLPPERPLIILLAGPTGVGKTDCAIELALQLGGEIINADSMQVYRRMEIGTAKPGPAQRALVPQYLLDVVDPDEPFDAGHYLQLVQPVIEALHGRGKLPLVVGGTGLYMKVLTRGICPVPPSDPTVKRQLLQELESFGPARLHKDLLKVDPESARRIHSNDRQRIVRALEVFRVTGKPLSHWQAGHGFREPLYRALKLFLFRPREELYRRIDARVETMMAEGFLDEVRGLLAQGYGPRLKPMQSLGYRQLVRHLQGECSLPEAVNEIQRDTRRYAKRQITWFRADPEFVWCSPADDQRMLDLVRETISRTYALLHHHSDGSRKPGI
jgi:tRNA dimethylallyltransferase